MSQDCDASTLALPSEKWMMMGRVELEIVSLSSVD